MSDYTDYIEGLAEVGRTEVESYVSRWYGGKHRTRDGRDMLLSEMTPAHLRATINYFKGNKLFMNLGGTVEPLEEELAARTRAQ